MLVWRICKAVHAAAPLSGEGARRFGGRWNEKGTRMVYTAGSQSLATLEVLVHLTLSEVPKDYQAIAIELPEHLPCLRLPASSLPTDWRGVPGPESLKKIGTAWLQAGREAILMVPSAIIPEEWDVLLNPEHPDAAHFQARAPLPFAFDPRLF